MINKDFAQETADVEQQGLSLDASILLADGYYESLREDVKQSRMVYEFPEGLNQVDILEECRALTMLEDFDTWYDLTMQMLAGKPVRIFILNKDGSKTELCALQVTDRYMDMRGVNAIAKFPWIVVWMVEFVKGYVSKKFPTPGNDLSRPQESGKTGGRNRKNTGKQTTT